MIFVSNGVKRFDPVQPFLGNAYPSLWHHRLVMSSKNEIVVQCDLVASPRSPRMSTKLFTATMTECESRSVSTVLP